MQAPSFVSFRARSLVAVTTFATIVALVATTATAALAGSGLSTMTEIASTSGSYGSQATEWSGATYNADTNKIMLVDDENQAYEVSLLANGAVDQTAAVRVLTITDGTADWEGVAWISGQQYAFLSEATGVAYIYEVPATSNLITSNDLVWSFEAGGPDDNTGSEGIAVGSDGSFYVTDEMPSSVSKYDASGNFVAEILVPELADATGVVAAQDNSLVVISHESANALHLDFDWTGGTYTQLAELDLSAFSQLEGVAMINNDQLHFWGERNGGKTHAHMTGTIVTSEFSASDVNCSGDVNITDAMHISQIEVGTAGPMPGCGNGDTNADGATNVVDALVIAQCQVGIENPHCDE